MLTATQRWNHPDLETGDDPHRVSNGARYAPLPDGDTLPDYRERWSPDSHSVLQNDQDSRHHAQDRPAGSRARSLGAPQAGLQSPIRITVQFPAVPTELVSHPL